MIASGPRALERGAPLTYVTTGKFLSVFGLETIRDLPDLDAPEDIGLLDRVALNPAVHDRADPNRHLRPIETAT